MVRLGAQMCDMSYFEIPLDDNQPNLPAATLNPGACVCLACIGTLALRPLHPHNGHRHPLSRAPRESLAACQGPASSPEPNVCRAPQPFSRSILQLMQYTHMNSRFSLYITNLPSAKIKKPDLRTALYLLFSTYGPVLDIVVLKTMRMRGQAHVVYRDIQTATQAMRALNGTEFLGMNMVRPAEPIDTQRHTDFACSL